MVEIKRTPAGQQVSRRFIGVKTPRVSAEKAYLQEAETFTQASNIAYEFAKDMQVKEAKKVASTISVRNEKGEIEFPKLPDNLGGFGTPVATEIAQKRYLTAAGNDFRTFADNLALNSANADDYKRNIATYVSENAIRMEASGGASVVPAYTETAYSYASQQASKIALQQYKQKETIAKANARMAHEGMLADIRSLRRDGTEESLKEAEFLEGIYRQELSNSMVMQGLTQEYVTERNRELDGSKVVADFQRAARNLSLRKTKELQYALETGTYNNAIKKAFPDLIAAREALPEQVVSTVSSAINQTVTRLNGLYENSTKVANAYKWASQNGAFGSGETERDYSEVLLTQEFGDVSSMAAIISNPNLTKPEFAARTRQFGALPTAMHDAIESLAHGSSIENITDVRGLRALQRATLNAITNEDGTIQDKALSPTALGYLFAIEEHVRANGSSEQSLLNAFQTIPRLLEDEGQAAIRIAKKLDIAKPGKKDAVELARDDLMSTYSNWNPDSYNEYGSVYAMLLTQTSKDVARNKVEALYNSTYQEYSYHYPTYGDSSKFRYTPKYYYSNPLDHLEFIEQMQVLGTAAYTQAGGEVEKPMLGVHFYIKSSPFNRPDKGEFVITDANGRPYLNEEMRPVIISTETVSTTKTNLQIAQEEAADNVRIAELLDSVADLPMFIDIEDPFSEGGAPLFGR